MIKLNFLKLPVVIAAALFGIIQPLLAVELSPSNENASQMSQDKLKELVKKFETMSLLDAQKALEDVSKDLDQKALVEAFKFAQKKDNAVGMAVIANQFKILQGGADVLSDLASIKIGVAEVKNKLTQILGEMIQESQKSPKWSDESIRLTTNTIGGRSEQVSQDVRGLVESILEPLLANQNGRKLGASRLNAYNSTYVRSLAAELQKHSAD